MIHYFNDLCTTGLKWFQLFGVLRSIGRGPLSQLTMFPLETELTRNYTIGLCREDTRDIISQPIKSLLYTNFSEWYDGGVGSIFLSDLQFSWSVFLTVQTYNLAYDSVQYFICNSLIECPPVATQRWNQRSSHY